MREADTNHKNKAHYEKKYRAYSIRNILHWLKDPNAFLDAATLTETSWFAIYHSDFRHKLAGSTVVEMGCGDCVNAALMAALGAKVFANDIADSSGEIVKALNENYNFNHPITYVPGDFLKNQLPSNTFDFVIGKAFLHHLEIPLEQQFLKETARLLNTSGEARFFEPAVNNRFLDEIRWHIPVKGRPSKFQHKAFQKWREGDPHPDRSFSSAHFEQAGRQYFQEVKIIPVGTLERFSRLMKWGAKRNKFKRWALKNENRLPAGLNRSFSRSQLIIYRKPKQKD